MEQHVLLRLLRWFCPPVLYEGIEGDLLEQFEADALAYGPRVAKKKFVIHALRFFRLSIFLRNRFSISQNITPMLSSYLKITYRNAWRNKGYSLINVVGLSLGVAVCLLTFAFVRFELSYDREHPDVERTYRVNQTNIWDPAGGVFGSVGPAVAFALKSDFPEMEAITRINTPGAQIVRYTDEQGKVVAFNEESVLAADSNFFSFFYFRLQEGTTQALYGKNKVVLSDRAAKRLFGDTPALGKLIQIGDDKITAEVTGVTAPQPENVHFHFDYLMSMYTNPDIKQFEWSWIWTQTVTYVKLRHDANLDNVQQRLLSFADRHAPATFKKIGMDYESFVNEKGGWFLYLQPLSDLYLHSRTIGNRIGPVGDIRYVYILSGVSLFILIIAIINFVNLSTARGATRAKEVGVKKALGLRRSSLMAQFHVEHIVLSTVSMLFGIGLMELFRALVQPFVGVAMPSPWQWPGFFGVIVIFPIVVGFLAGLYPSVFLTAFNPTQVLKGKLAIGMRSSALRNGLVVLQFSISIALMAATLVVFQQLDFFRTQNIGFDRENLLIINHADKLGTQLESFRNEIAEVPGVSKAALSMDIRAGYEDIFTPEGLDRRVSISQYKIDEHFFGATGLSLASGRAFDAERPSDQNAIIINETTARLLEWTNEEALGKKIVYLGDEIGPQEVIGVVKDFHFQSLHQNIVPMMFMNIRSNMWGQERIVTVRYQGEPYELLARLEAKWKKLSGESVPFSYSFYDEEVRAQYKQEERLGLLFSIFTGLSMLIASVGLIGLVAYAAETRKKELGIRKVFGASTSGLVLLMNQQYVRLIAVALLISTPVAWWVLDGWLNSFAYKISINIWVFVAAGLAELTLAFLAVGYLSFRAASLNPARVLKDE